MLPGGRSLEKMEMDANSGEPWSEMDIADLAYSLACDGTIRGHGEASWCRDEERRCARKRDSSV